MTNSGRPPTRMEKLPGRIRALVRVWGELLVVALVTSLVFGPIGPLMVVALLATIVLPIVALYLWGRALDEELGWLHDDDEGPW